MEENQEKTTENLNETEANVAPETSEKTSNTENGAIPDIKAMEEKIAFLEKEVEKWKDGYIRKVAEFENIKKRMDKEKEDFQKYSNEKIILKFLEAVDNLGRAMDSSRNSKDFDSLAKGVEMTFNQFSSILETEGVKALEAKGKDFDPYEHHAVMQEETDEHPHNTVMEEFQKGYKLKEKIIRPALVKVAKKK